MSNAGMKRLFKALACVIFGVTLIYVGSYVWMSSQGRYEPAVIGIRGVKNYAWAPKGFVTNYQWSQARYRFYWPLWRLDHEFWHTPDRAYDGRYPIHEPEHIGEVYQAWSN
jgi:hypothetical protein